MAVVKADAYGHGAAEVARTALRHGADRVGVAILEEAIALKKAGISSPIHMLGEALPGQFDAILAYGVVPTLGSKETALALARKAVDRGQRVKIHVKVDTGLARFGVPWAEAVHFVRELQARPELEVEGIYTHFADADRPDSPFVKEQLARFQHVLDGLTREGLRPPLAHTSGSGAIVNYPEAHFDLVRPGLLLLGLCSSPTPELSLALRPVLTVRTRIAAIRELPARTPVGYGMTHVTTRATRIASIPIGFASGYPRSLSNRVCVLLYGRRVPIVGLIGLNHSLVDVTGISRTAVGDLVTVIGRDGGEHISVGELAEIAGTVVDEVCMLAVRLPKTYLQDTDRIEASRETEW